MPKMPSFNRNWNGPNGPWRLIECKRVSYLPEAGFELLMFIRKNGGEIPYRYYYRNNNKILKRSFLLQRVETITYGDDESKNLGNNEMALITYQYTE